MILTPLLAIVPMLTPALEPPTTTTNQAKPAQAEKPVSLYRVFTKGEKLEYELKADMHQEERMRGLNTWMPSEEDIIYKFTMETLELKSDGGALIRYLRPTITDIMGETTDSGPKTEIHKVNWNLLLTLSPINELLNIKDQTKKPEKPKNKDDGGDGGDKNDQAIVVRSMVPFVKAQLEAILQSLNGGLTDMVLFIGSLDSGLDLAPKLPLEDVTPGYTWKKTGGFSPQKLPGEGAKMAVQRLDYTYTYIGPVEESGKKFLKVHAELNLETSMADYIHQMMEMKPSETGLKELPFKLKSQIDFYLDPKTKRTVKAAASSDAEAKIVVNAYPEPIEELKMIGTTTLRLLSVKP